MLCNLRQLNSATAFLQPTALKYTGRIYQRRVCWCFGIYYLSFCVYFYFTRYHRDANTILVVSFRRWDTLCCIGSLS